ncbi:class I SAM-dependent methyltransferase [Streptomyces qinzhouensis]|uniref:Class I SAM-dependent methyltransferase n=1 Tax=Streptomyces qinzhouensis TaxID=2599401 RepID=A0A5B8JJD9_9ACTN|nr:class I SAM-dependent methyltransferase [Streptomyces qinzhouensis]QDY80564.1 class I SAM-dependent methyltransferase [Streptomyces qinzhouensis]
MRNHDWHGGDYPAAGDAWAHAADDVTATALAALDPTGTSGAGTKTTTDATGTTVTGATAAAPATARVLDVGTGSGPAALAAARAGAHVVGLDLEPGLLRTAVSRARGLGPTDGTVRFVAGDARALPFPAGAFDLTLSTFGVMFAPEPARTGAELVRVTRPGGLIAVASWTPGGVMGRIAPTVRRHLGPEPDGTPSPTDWGDPSRIRSWFAELPVTVHTRVERVRVRYPSLSHAVAAFENKPGPLRRHRTALEAAHRWQHARADLAALFALHNRSADGDLVFDAVYLLLLARVGIPSRTPPGPLTGRPDAVDRPAARAPRGSTAH